MDSKNALIKICGITTREDAAAALDAGADFLGLIFAPKSARCIDVARAKDIISAVAGRAKIVGVFKDQDFQFVSSLATDLALDYVQCHGAETVEYVQQMPVKVIRTIELSALTVDDAAMEAKKSVEIWQDVASLLLFDRPKNISDETWYARAVEGLNRLKPIAVPFLFAGGLTAANVGFVVEHLKPFGVDVASSVEYAPGKKDIGKMHAFCTAVKDHGEGVEACAH